MALNRQDIDSLVKQFNARPSKNDYITVNNWYNASMQTYPDVEYLTCVYLFLLGANIKNQYIPFTKEQHREWVVEITKLVESADRMTQSQRKVYFDLGARAGFYK